MTDAVSFALQTAAAVYTRISTMKINREEIAALALRVNLLMGCLKSSDQLTNAQDKSTQEVLAKINDTLRQANILLSDMERQNHLQRFFWSKEYALSIKNISNDITSYVQLLGVASDGMQLCYLQDIQKLVEDRRRREDDVSGQIRLLRQAVLEVQRMKHDRRQSTVSLRNLHKTIMDEDKPTKDPAVVDESPARKDESPSKPDQEESMIGEIGDMGSLPDDVRELLLRPKYQSMLLDKSLLSFTESEDSPSGAFGVVHRGTFLGQPIVVKMLLTKKPTLRSIKEILDEAVLMKRYNFDFFATVYGICVVDGAPAIVMKRMDTDLFNYLHKEINQPVIQSITWKVETALAVSKAVEALHSLHLLHRDLKSPNILVSGRGAKPLCISDFGMARLRKEIASMQRRSQIELGQHETVGSYPWMAPEIMEAGKYTSKADIFSLGVILWEIWTGQEPWSDAVSVKAIERAVLSGKLLPMQGIPPRIEVLLRRMFAHQPKERPPATEVTKELMGFSEENDLGIQAPETLPDLGPPTSSHTQSESWGSASSNMDYSNAISNTSSVQASHPPTINESSPVPSSVPVNFISHTFKPDLKTSNTAIKKKLKTARYLEITSIVLIGVSFCFGLGSIIATAIAWSEYESSSYYDDDSSASAGAVACGALSLIFALVAVPLAFFAGKMFLANRNQSQHGPCTRGWMIAGWVVYGIMTINGLATVGVGASGGDVVTGWVVFAVLLLLIGWGLMIVYTELGRRKASQDTLPQQHQDETHNMSESAGAGNIQNQSMTPPTTASSNTYQNISPMNNYHTSVSSGTNTNTYRSSTSSGVHNSYELPASHGTGEVLSA